MPDELFAVTKLLATTTLPELLSETLAVLEEWGQRRLPFGSSGAGVAPLQPTFPYADLSSSTHLTYELVGWHNFGTYLSLFADDPSPFVEPLFKQRPALESYAVLLLTDMRYS